MCILLSPGTPPLLKLAASHGAESRKRYDAPSCPAARVNPVLQGGVERKQPLAILTPPLS